MTPTLPPDQTERAAVLAPERSFALKAPAGSGKTGLLVQRVLMLLAQAAQPEEILAITFTRKAAGEMQSRVLNALAAAASEQPVRDMHEQATRTLALRALAQDQAQGWNLRQHPQRLRVQTLDAFCAMLAKRHPLSAGLGGVYPSSDDAYPLYRDAARRCFERGPREAWEALLPQLDNRVDAVLEGLASMLARREQWLREIVPLGEDLRSHAEAAFKKMVVARLRLAQEALAHLPADTLAQVLPAVAAGLADGQSALGALADCTGLPEARIDALPAWRGLAELLLTNEGAPRRAFRRAQGVLPAGEASGEEKKRRVALRQSCEALSAALSGDAAAALGLAGQLPEPEFSAATWARVEAVLALLRHAAAELSLVFRERGAVDFTEVALAARQALGSPDQPTDLLLALDYRIRHILVDEFQDTSQLQVELLECLTAGWSAGDGRSLFLVGDGMQSIYRFRHARVELFRRAIDIGIGPLTLERRALRANFRSTTGLVDWVNQLFGTLGSSDKSMLFVPAIAQNGGPAAGAQWHRCADAQAEAERVVELVQAALAADHAGEVAILVRARRHLGAIVPALKAAGIPYQAVEVDQLGGLAVIQDLFMLTRAFLRPADRLAWLALLHAPWVGLNLADLTRLTAAAETSAWTPAQLSTAARQLSPEGEGRLMRFLDVFEPALLRRGRQALAPLLEGVWLALGGPALLEADERAAAQLFFTTLSGYSQAGDLPEFGAFAAQIEALHAPVSPHATRLRVMTVHKAKGLEFDTVIIPGLDRQAPSSPAPLLQWRVEPGAGLLLAPAANRSDGKEAANLALESLEAADDDAETLRLLYVALTRARRVLHLCAVLPEATTAKEPLPAKGSLLRRIWEAVKDEVLAQEIVVAGASTASSPAGMVRPLRRLAVDSPLPCWPDSEPVAALELPPTWQLPPFDWAQEEARAIGVATHRLLQLIGEEGAEQWGRDRVNSLRGPARALLRAEGLVGGRQEDALDSVLQGLQGTLADARGAWVLSAGHAEARCEWALSGWVDGGLLRVQIDRSFVAQGTRWIVDYKTGIHSGPDRDAFLDAERQRYAPQLERYARLLAGRESRPIRLGLYFPRLQGWREWPWQASRI